MTTWQSHAYQLLMCPLGWQRVVSFDLLGRVNVRVCENIFICNDHGGYHLSPGCGFPFIFTSGVFSSKTQCFYDTNPFINLKKLCFKMFKNLIENISVLSSVLSSFICLHKF